MADPADTKNANVGARRRVGCAVIAIGVIVLIAAGAMFLPKAPDTPKLSNGYTEDDTRARAMVAVEGRLKDPHSATFSEIYVSDIAGTVSACGDVNAKNGFGGYTGSKSFIVVGRSAIFAPDLGQKAFDAMWSARCAGKSK